MHELPLLINIAVALVVAFIGGVAARALRLPTLVGYMLAGIAIGPFTPGFAGDIHTISQLAELGVIFLMFGVGLHFSLGDLWKVRDIAIPGSVGSMLIITLIGYLLTQHWGWSQGASLVLGLAISVASTVVLLRGLMDNGLLNSAAGQAAVGWLVLEDIATVVILVLLPTIAGHEGGFAWGQLGLTLLKAAAFVALLAFVGRKLIPWILSSIARTGSRELFVLAILAISVGIALAAIEIFGVSLALGAFAAGIVVSESKLSHQVSADIVPFREAFSVLFFVSIGMLVNVGYLAENVGTVLVLCAIIVIGKYVLTVLLGTVIKHSARTFLIVAAGRSQIGEFSFILGQAGLSLALLSQEQYSLILAGALISITINPLMYKLSDAVEPRLRKIGPVWQLLDRQGPLPSPPAEMSDHVVVVGYGRVGHHIVDVLGKLKVQLLVVDNDVERLEELAKKGVPTLYGDAANSEVLVHAGLQRARLLVVTTPEDETNEIIIASARAETPKIHIIARGSTDEGVEHLTRLGTNQVIRPELEGGLQIVRRTLLELGFSIRKVQQYTDAVRADRYDPLINTVDERQFLQDFLAASDNLELRWIRLAQESPLAGKSLVDARLREISGASVAALSRDSELIANPTPQTVLMAEDLIGVIGDERQIEAASKALTEKKGLLKSPTGG